MTQLPLKEWTKYKDDKEFKEDLYRRVTNRSPEGAMCIRMGTHIAQALKKEVDPLHLMFGMDDVINNLYAEMIHSGDLRNLTTACLDMIGHSRTDLRVLEVGAGTGSVTAVVLETLSPLPAHEQSSGKSSRIAKYTFTDISAGFFEKAKDRFKGWKNLVDYQVLNIENELKDQGFVEGDYDLIIASNVLHATGDLRKTLKNVRSLLKPGGRLVLHEGIRWDFVFMPLIFGQVEGWWLSIEPEREWCPWLNEEQWNLFLKDSGFSGTDIRLRDWPEPDVHGISVLVASATGGEEYKSRISQETLIVTTGQTQSGQSFGHMIAEKLVERFGLKNCSVIGYQDLINRDLSSTFCLSLVELERSLIVDVTEDEFTNLKHLLATCEGLLWVTGDITKKPELNMIAGLIRTVRWERDLEKTNQITLAVADPQPLQSEIIHAILEIFKHQYVNGSEAKENAEYLLRNGTIFTNRLVDATDMNDFLTAKVSKPIAQMMPLEKAEGDGPLRLTTRASGTLTKFQFEKDPIWYEPLEKHEVEVQVKAAGLNFRDVMIATGEHNALTFGSEGAGVVTRVGSGVTKIKTGDRVVYIDGIGRTGAFQTYGRAIEDLLAVIPGDMSFEVAASLPSTYITSIYGLYHLAKLSRGETILIHSAAGAVGQAATMLANLVGAEVFATVSTPKEAELITDKYGVKKDHIFSSLDLSFANGIMRMTKGQGVDVVLNSLSGEFLRRTWDCIGVFGRFIEIGNKDALNHGRVTMQPFLRNVTMASIELPTILKHRHKLKENPAGLLQETIRLYTEGQIKEPSSITVFDYSRIEEAFKLLQSGKDMGKIVLTPTPESIVPVIPEPPKPLKLKKNASYVLAGGLGGTGRSVALWIAARGAKNLIFLSRSATASEAAQETVRELESRGVRVRAFSCDVSDENQLAAVIKECNATFPPIRGCIQGAMVLGDKIFENMTHEEWRAATRPKVQGSWNLHGQLPKQLDFFILLSSVAGLVGNRGQANYAAGNTYQDALAAYRVSLGLPATSLDLGTLLSVGFVAESRDRLGGFTKNVAPLLGTVREDEIHTMIEHNMDPAKYATRPSQISSTLITASEYAARGMPMPSWMYWPLFTQLASTSSVTTTFGGAESDSGVDIPALLGAAASFANAVAIISDQIRTKLSKLLSIPLENIDPSKSVSSNGVDSLAAVQFRTWLVRDMSADVPLLEILGSMPIMGTAGLSGKVATISKLVPENLRKAEEGEAK